MSRGRTRVRGGTEHLSLRELRQNARLMPKSDDWPVWPTDRGDGVVLWTACDGRLGYGVGDRPLDAYRACFFTPDFTCPVHYRTPVAL